MTPESEKVLNITHQETNINEPPETPDFSPIRVLRRWEQVLPHFADGSTNCHNLYGGQLGNNYPNDRRVYPLNSQLGGAILQTHLHTYKMGCVPDYAVQQKPQNNSCPSRAHYINLTDTRKTESCEEGVEHVLN